MMSVVDWTTLVSTAVGAAIAFSGTVVADHLRRRDSRHRYSYGERQRAYSEMVLALGAGLDRLRDVAQSERRHDKLTTATGKAVSEAGVYVAREKILMTAEPAVAQAAEDAFDGLIGVRDAVRSGAQLRTPAFHDAYHPYADKMWLLRKAIRADLKAPVLHPNDLGRSQWSGRADCEVCTPQTAP